MVVEQVLVCEEEMVLEELYVFTELLISPEGIELYTHVSCFRAYKQAFTNTH